MPLQHVRSTNVQISMRACAQADQDLRCLHRELTDTVGYIDNREGPGKTARMHKLIYAFAVGIRAFFSIYFYH